MKYVVVILDGAAGHPLESLGGRTSLQAADTPRLDRMAREGIVGLAATVPEGAEPSSSAACTSILGYDPVADYVGRGAIEAASIGITLGPDEVALRLNTVTIIDGVMTSYAAGHISTEESGEIVRALAAELDDDTFRLHPGVAYRHILVVKGHPELLDLGFTPPHDISDRPVEGHSPRGEGAEILLGYMDRAKALLPGIAANIARAEAGKMPVTDVWPFWPGVRPSGMVPFERSRGVRAAMSSGVDLLNGLAVLTGIDRLDIPGVTGGSDNDYDGQARGCLTALSDHDLVVIHVESPDEEGHAGDAAAKIEAIEAIDRDVLMQVLAYAEREGDVRVLAMPDHPTPVALKTHVGEPVPFVLWGAGVPAGGAVTYDERAAEASGLVVDPGRGVMDLLITPSLL